MGIEVKGPKVAGSEAILTREALALVERLHRELNPRREQLLARRAERQRELDRGQEFRFLPETQKVRDGDWKVASIPEDLAKRFVEITGPVERKMMINALRTRRSPRSWSARAAGTCRRSTCWWTGSRSPGACSTSL